MFANLPLFLSYYPPLILIFAENYNQKHPHMSPITERNGEMMRRGRIEVICGSMVLRQDRRTDPKIETSRVRPPKRRNIQTIHRHTLCRTRRGVARRKLHSLHPRRFFCQYPAAGSDTDVVGIDEAQFFDENLIDVCNELANRGTRVIVAGLDLDFKGVPFGPMPDYAPWRTK